MYILMLFATLYPSVKIYEMANGKYLDGTEVMRVNGHLLTKNDKEQLLTLMQAKDNHHAYVKEEPTYSLSYEMESDLDPGHLHVFRNEKLIYFGCLLGLESGGLELDGYLLTKELDTFLERLDKKYSWN